MLKKIVELAIFLATLVAVIQLNIFKSVTNPLRPDSPSLESVEGFGAFIVAVLWMGLMTWLIMKMKYFTEMTDVSTLFALLVLFVVMIAYAVVLNNLVSGDISEYKKNVEIGLLLWVVGFLAAFVISKDIGIQAKQILSKWEKKEGKNLAKIL